MKPVLIDYSCSFFKETKALLEQEENLLDKVDDVDSDLERTYNTNWSDLE
jgi:hypothetical protein